MTYFPAGKPLIIQPQRNPANCDELKEANQAEYWGAPVSLRNNNITLLNAGLVEGSLTRLQRDLFVWFVGLLLRPVGLKVTD